MNAQEYLRGLHLAHFSAEELLYRGASDQDLGLNTDPPGAVLANIRRTGWVASLARSALGVPIRILSAYRSPAYNAAIGGAPKSLHVQFNALDLDPYQVAPRELFDLLYRWRDEGLFKGGLGLYRSFVHLDTRGHNATWGV